LVKDNHLLGKFDLTGIPPAPRGVPQIEVTFSIDENSILSVKAKERGTGRTESITITNDKSRLSKDEIDQMIKDAEKYAEQDKELRDKLDAKASLDNYLHTMRSTVDDRDKLADKLDYSDKNKIRDALDEAESWLRSNEDSASKEDFEDHLKTVQKICDPIIAKLYQKFGGQKQEDEEQNDEF
jgi:heat shock protein 5